MITVNVLKATLTNLEPLRHSSWQWYHLEVLVPVFNGMSSLIVSCTKIIQIVGSFLILDNYTKISIVFCIQIKPTPFEKLKLTLNTLMPPCYCAYL